MLIVGATTTGGVVMILSTDLSRIATLAKARPNPGPVDITGTGRLRQRHGSQLAHAGSAWPGVTGFRHDWPVSPRTLEGKTMHSSLSAPRRPLQRTGLALALAMVLAAGLALTACTQEQQNQLGRGIQNWTGTDGVLDVYTGEKLAMRFIQIDKMSTGLGTQDNEPRSFRYGYGVVDENFNWLKDPGEKKVYFEVSDYSTSYVFYENYKD
jgi:hypothetical protein